MHYKSNSFVLCKVLNTSIVFEDDWSKGKEMATDLRDSRWRRPPSRVLAHRHFKNNSCVPCNILHIPIKFGEDWSDGKKIATDF